MTDETVFQHDFFDTSGMDDFIIKDAGDPPPGYPLGPRPDDYAFDPFESTYAARKEALFDHCCRNPAGPNIKGYYYELARLHKNRGPIHEGLILGVLGYIDQRYDCSDFVLLGMVRILYQFFEHPLLGSEIKERLVKTILDFKYHPEEPGIDSMCYWTENHQIMFAANEYLAGQKFPEAVFTNSDLTGKQKMAKAEKRILKWLELRFLTGFSEWLSHIYYDEDMTALINLVDFCDNPKIRQGAAMVLDLLFFDMALNSYHGIYGSSHGRSYTKEKQDARVESTTDTQKLAFGMGVFAGRDNMGAVSLALSERYRLPRVIYEIALDDQREETFNRQRMSINVRDAKRWGLNYTDLESGLIFLSLEAYTHPKTVNLFVKMLDAYRWWENQFFEDFKANRSLLELARKTGTLPLLVKPIQKDIARNTREEVNVCTYKTPDYMLSNAQDYRPGYGGDQQHIWQATLGPGAVCFTTHPGHKEDTSGGYWIGSGTLPRTAQIDNLLIAAYNASKMPGLYMTNKLFFTHAWFPRDEFDETIETRGWIFGRKNDGYIALYSRKGYHWQTEGDDRDREVIAEGKKNIWICEMGRKAVDGDFTAFVEKISTAPLVFKAKRVSYDSPSQGKVEFGWKGPLKRKGRTVPLHDYSRYDNPYAQAAFAASEIVIQHGSYSLKLDLEKGIRETEDFVF